VPFDFGCITVLSFFAYVKVKTGVWYWYQPVIATGYLVTKMVYAADHYCTAVERQRLQLAPETSWWSVVYYLLFNVI